MKDVAGLTTWHHNGVETSAQTAHTKPYYHNSMKTERTTTLPPFHTQTIGSLPRPQVVRDLIAKKDQMSSDRYQDSMATMVRFAIRLQEEAGLDVITDGEWRRTHYIHELFDRVGGFEQCRRFEHQGEMKTTQVVVGTMHYDTPVFAEDARFLSENTTRITKYALPSPFLIGIRFWHEDYSKDAYPTMQHFVDHLTQILRQEARALVQAGMDIVQIDDPALTYFCDRKLMAEQGSHDERLRRTWTPDIQIPQAVSAVNRIVEGLEAEVHLHCCHSVYKRNKDVSGNYKPLLPWLEGLSMDRINLEFAYSGTGEADDLSSLPEHLGVGMGIVDVRNEKMQSVDEMVQLALQGTKYVSPDRIALNPDCGFAPDAGEPPTIDEAYAKLCRLVTVSHCVNQQISSKHKQA